METWAPSGVRGQHVVVEYLKLHLLCTRAARQGSTPQVTPAVLHWVHREFGVSCQMTTCCFGFYKDRLSILRTSLTTALALCEIPTCFWPCQRAGSVKETKRKLAYIYVVSMGSRAEDETDLQDLQAIVKAEESSDQQRSFSSKNPSGPPDKSPPCGRWHWSWLRDPCFSPWDIDWYHF